MSDLLAIEAQLVEARRTVSALVEANKKAKASCRAAMMTQAAARAAYALQQRRAGQPYTEIAEFMGISGTRARQLAKRAERVEVAKALYAGELSVRTENCLRNNYALAGGVITKEVIIAASKELPRLMATPNFGKKSAKEITKAAAFFEATA